MANDIIVSEMTSATQINTNDLMIMTQPDLQAETGYSTKKGTVLQVANKMLKGTEYLTDLPDFTNKTVLGGLEELKGDLTALLPVDTASGAIANFDTDLSLPLVDCKAYIVASQASGTPTPSSPLAISGYTGVTVSVADENMSVQDTYSVSWQTEAGTVYGGNLDLTTGLLTVTHGYVDLGDNSITWGYNSTNAFFYAEISGIKQKTNNLLCTAYSVITTKYPNEMGTVPDKTVCTRNYNGNQIQIKDTSYTDATAFKTAMSGVMLAYELATPDTYQLTPTQVEALLGVNNIYNDTNGDTEVKYKEGIQHYIDKKIAATQALIL